MNNAASGTWVPFTSSLFGAGSSLSLLNIDLLFYPVTGDWAGTLYLDDSAPRRRGKGAVMAT
jgi:hypothetical protein